MNRNLINLDNLMAMSWKDLVMFLATHNAEERILRAIIRTKPESEWEQLIDENTPQTVSHAIDTIYWEKNDFTHRYEIKDQPKYRSSDEVLRDFLSTGKRQIARKELQVRLQHLTPYEQKRILYAFMDSDTKLDRAFACKYLDKHFEPMYLKAIETIWGLYHEYEAAKVLAHYVSDEFIAEHFVQLAEDYRYLPVRLRMPASTRLTIQDWRHTNLSVSVLVSTCRLQSRRLLLFCPHLIPALYYGHWVNSASRILSCTTIGKCCPNNLLTSKEIPNFANKFNLIKQ